MNAFKGIVPETTRRILGKVVAAKHRAHADRGSPFLLPVRRPVKRRDSQVHLERVETAARANTTPARRR